MNKTIMFGIIAGMLLLLGMAIYVSSSVIAKDSSQASVSQPSQPSCSISGSNGSCGSSCTASSNCELSTCGAKSGGTCSCGAK
jgi:hypothetical protein